MPIMPPTAAACSSASFFAAMLSFTFENESAVRVEGNF
jgi:hypothetical protein